MNQERSPRRSGPRPCEVLLAGERLLSEWIRVVSPLCEDAAVNEAAEHVAKGLGVMRRRLAAELAFEPVSRAVH